ncbi:hypothetical protein TNCV_3001561 [Trichonephila clavipes]|nr:hypothetical protein TNCV_3001561 [Trichonephila clavipes]
MFDVLFVEDPILDYVQIPSNCLNCKRDHPANFPNCPMFIKETKILEFKCTKHLTFGEARRKSKETHSANYAITVKTAAPGSNIQEFEKKVENIVENFQAALEKQTTTSSAHRNFSRGGGESGVESSPFLNHAPFDFVNFREQNTVKN